MRKPFKITIEGSDRDERRRLLDLFNDFIAAEGVYRHCSGSYPFEAETSAHGYEIIQQDQIYADMSVGACMARYVEAGKRIKDRINAGSVSASMSGIEMYWGNPLNMDEDDPTVLQANLTWNGQVHIHRPDWLEQYQAWKSAQKPPTP